MLIALIDTRHVRHEDAHAWFEAAGRHAWATCPLTELGVLRVVGHSSYPNSPGTPAAVAESLLSLCNSGGHEFWPDAFSPLRHELVQVERLLQAAQLTDSYLLGLAALHNAQLATFDRRVVADAVKHGRAALHVLD